MLLPLVLVLILLESVLPILLLITPAALNTHIIPLHATAATVTTTTTTANVSQLSAQKHYDWGLRNILAVLRTAGQTKRDNIDKPEAFLMYRCVPVATMH
jgi:squalene cyclase